MGYGDILLVMAEYHVAESMTKLGKPERQKKNSIHNVWMEFFLSEHVLSISLLP